MADDKAKQPKKQGFSLQGFDANSYKQTEAYTAAIDALYNQAVNEFANLAGKVTVSPDKPFTFADFPATQTKAQQIVDQLAGKMQAVIVKGSRDQWLYACKKNDEFLKHIMNTSKLPKKTLAKFQDRNLDALKTFQTRKVNGMDLSKRVWNYAGQMKTQMELGIDIAVGEGKSAASLSRDLRKYLVDPDKLFHKVKDKHGVLHLSKNAEAFHPGQGKYRSSYKNAMRLTRSEINMAYRVSDQLRWQQLDFVVGFEIKLSNNHTTLINGVPTPFTDICDELQGRYPKWFTFKGWHPQCRCHIVPIMQSREEMGDDMVNELRAAIKGTQYKPFESKNTISDVPDNFKQFISDKAEVSAGWKSQPYWIKDNFQGGTIAGGLKVAPQSVINVVRPIIKESAETPETTSKLDEIVNTMEKAGIKYNEVVEYKKIPTEIEIIERLGGGDMTRGSCSSLAFAYAGNKIGLDVLDFRDGTSRMNFSHSGTIQKIALKAGGKVAANTSDFVKAKELLQHVEYGKEYYFTCGKHAAIIRKTKGGFEYLELQSATKNGFKELTNEVLKKRFGAQRSHSVWGSKLETYDCIIDINLLKNDISFRKLLGYLNTNSDKQIKGLRGTMR